MIDRETFLADALSPSTNTDAPEWVVKEGAQEDDWEAVEKRKLELAAFARDFRRAFPSESFAGIYQQDRMSGAKKEVKSTDDVLYEAYQWLDKKARGDVKLALSIVDISGLVDQYRGPIAQMFKNAQGEDAVKEHEKTLNEYREMSDSPAQPADALAEDRASIEKAQELETDRQQAILKAKKASLTLERKKTVGSYGIIVTEHDTQLWKKGKLVVALDTKQLGGFAVIAEEVSSMETPADVETLFDVQPAVQPSTTVESPVSQPAVNAGQRVAFRMGQTCTAGTVSAVEGNEASVTIDGTDNVEVPVTVSELVPIKECCPIYVTQSFKFCANCGTKLGAI